jgi:integrase
MGILRARAERDAFATEVRAGMAPRRDHTTVREVGVKWLDYLHARVEVEDLAERTLDSYADAYRLHIEPDYGHRPIRSIEIDDLVKWHRRQQALGAAKWSIKARWMAWRSLTKYAVRMGYRETNPTDGLLPEERPKAGASSVRFLTREEIPRLLAAARDEDDCDLLATGIFTGMRASEILGLILDEVDHGAEELHVRFQMSRQGRRVRLKTIAGRRDIILMPELGKRLRRRRMRMERSSGTDLLFQSGTGRTLGYWSLQDRFARAAARAGIEGIVPHTMRHTFASILISEGRDPEFVRYQLGHAHTSTTLDTYAHLFDAARHAREAREGLQANFGAMLQGAKKGRSA